MTRGGAKRQTDGPERRCIVTGRTQPSTGLVRFVISPDAMVVPDILGRLPGRGLWVSAEREALAAAQSGQHFSRAARAKVTVPAELSDEVERQLVARIQELVSLSRKSGAAVAGYEKTKAWLADGRAALLLQASDGSERGRTKLRPPAGDRSLIDWLSGTELGWAFGRENVIHAALTGGGLTTRVVEEAAKLKGLRDTGNGASGAGKE